MRGDGETNGRDDDGEKEKNGREKTVPHHDGGYYVALAARSR